MAQPHTNTTWNLDLHYGNATYLAIIHTIPRSFRHTGLWYGNDIVNFYTLSISCAGMLHLIWEWYGVSPNSCPIHILSCDASYYWVIFSLFISQFSEVIMSLISAPMNYSKLGAQYYVLCIHQFEWYSQAKFCLEKLIYKQITTFQQWQKLKKPKTLV